MGFEYRYRLGSLGHYNAALRAATGGGVVRMSDEMANKLAEASPRRYLAKIEQIAEMVRKGPAYKVTNGGSTVILIGVTIKEDGGFEALKATLEKLGEKDGGKTAWALASVDVKDVEAGE
jgi:hypothetical protein